MVLEFPPSGGIFTTYEIIPTGLFPYTNRTSFYLAGFEMVFVFLVIFHLFEEVRELFYFQSGYWFRFWNWVDLLQTVVI